MDISNSLPGPEDIILNDLPNGIRLLIRPVMYTESVSCLGYLNTGSISDPDDKLGLSQFTAAALMSGTQQLDFLTLHNTIESLGAHLSFSSGTNTTNFSCQCLNEDLPSMLDLIFDVLISPSFPQKQFNRIKSQFLTGLALRAEDTTEMASLEFDKLIYAGHPYSRPDDGYVETIQTIQLDDLVTHHRKNYGPNGMTIAIVGAVNPEKVIAQIENEFSGWLNPELIARPSVPDLAGSGVEQRKHVVIPLKSQSDIVMGSIGPSRKTEDYLPCALGNNILGQFGLMGRIGDIVREKHGLAYYAQSNLNSGMGPGAWEFNAGVNPLNVEKVIGLIKKEIARYLNKGVTAAELNDTKSYLVGRLPLSLESNIGVAVSLLNINRFDLGWDYLQKYAELINAVSLEQILVSSQKYLSADRLAIISAGIELK